MDFIKGVVKAIIGGIAAGAELFWNLVKWGLHRLIGLLEMLGSFLGIRFMKKLRVRVVILRDANGVPIAQRSAIEAVVQLADEVFRDEAKVKLASAGGRGDYRIIHTMDDPAPDYVMRPKCDGGGYWQAFGKVGTWFRGHSAATIAGTYAGYGTPVTIFVVDDVQGKAGCFIPFVGDYGFIDSGALSGSEGRLLTLAHELGHSCDLRHRSNNSLMEADPEPRLRRLTHLQEVVLRSSPRVTYF